MESNEEKTVVDESDGTKDAQETVEGSDTVSSETEGAPATSDTDVGDGDKKPEFDISMSEITGAFSNDTGEIEEKIPQNPVDSLPAEVPSENINAVDKEEDVEKEGSEEEEVLADEVAAIQIQKTLRGKQARQQVQSMKEEKNAAMTIQRQVRGKQARKQVEEKKLQVEEEKQQANAALTIQRNVRGKNARKELEEMKSAATSIQKVYRGNATRKNSTSAATENGAGPGAEQDTEKNIVNIGDSVIDLNGITNIDDLKKLLKTTAQALRHEKNMRLSEEKSADELLFASMTPAEGMTHGESGWYYDGSGEWSYWNVDAKGRPSMDPNQQDDDQDHFQPVGDTKHGESGWYAGRDGRQSYWQVDKDGTWSEQIMHEEASRAAQDIQRIIRGKKERKKHQARMETHEFRKYVANKMELKVLLEKKSSHLAALQQQLASLEEFIGDWNAETSQKAVGELNEMLSEYLQFHDFANTLECFQAEFMAKTMETRSVSSSESSSMQESKDATMEMTRHSRILRRILSAYDGGRYDVFFDMWKKHVPVNVRKSSEAMEVCFYAQVHFCIFPIIYEDKRTRGAGVTRGATEATPSKSSMQVAKERFIAYLQGEGALVNSPEFIKYFALPHVMNPKSHPSFVHLFLKAKDSHKNPWLEEQRSRLERLLVMTLEQTPAPRLFRVFQAFCSDHGILREQLKDSQERSRSQLDTMRSIFHLAVKLGKDLHQLFESSGVEANSKVGLSESYFLKLKQDLAIAHAELQFKVPANLALGPLAPQTIESKASNLEVGGLGNICKLNHIRVKRTMSTSNSIFSKCMLLDALRHRLSYARPSKALLRMKRMKGEKMMRFKQRKFKVIFTHRKSIASDFTLGDVLCRVPGGSGTIDKENIKDLTNDEDRTFLLKQQDGKLNLKTTILHLLSLYTEDHTSQIVMPEENGLLEEKRVFKDITSSESYLRAHTMLFLDALTKYQSGKLYLCAEGNIVSCLICVLRTASKSNFAIDKLSVRHCIHCLQRFSLKEEYAELMIKHGVLSIVSEILRGVIHGESQYFKAYSFRSAFALLLNLCVLPSGADAAHSSVMATTEIDSETTNIIDVLVQMLESEFSSFGDSMGRRQSFAGELDSIIKMIILDEVPEPYKYSPGTQDNETLFVDEKDEIEVFISRTDDETDDPLLTELQKATLRLPKNRASPNEPITDTILKSQLDEDEGLKLRGERLLRKLYSAGDKNDHIRENVVLTRINKLDMYEKDMPSSGNATKNVEKQRDEQIKAQDKRLA
eukprot:g3071.t1